MFRKGIITPLILIVFCVAMIIIIYLNYISTLESNISIAHGDKIQAIYLGKTKINRLLYDEYYYDTIFLSAIENYLKSPLQKAEQTFNLRDSDIESGDKYKHLKLKFITKDNKRYVNILTEVDYKGFFVRCSMDKRYINSIFENGSLPLISNDLDFNTCLNLERFLENLENLDMRDIPSDFVKVDDDKIEVQIEARNSSLYKIKTISNSNVETKEYNRLTNNKLFLNIRNQSNNQNILRILDNPSYSTLSLKGLIILQGDLIIQKRFDFNGIIILRGEDSKIIVENEVLDYKPTIKGIIITEGKTDFIDKIKLTYNWDYIGQFGLYLPGFIDIQDE